MTIPKPKTITKFLSIFLLIVIGSIINGCRKDGKSVPQTVLPSSVGVAKLWYESSYPVNSSTNEKLVTQGVGTINTAVDLSQHIKPDWQHSTSYKRFGKDVIEMPIDPSGNIATALSNKPGGNAVYKKQYSRSSFILLNDGTNYEAYVMTIIADSAYLKNDLTKLDRNKYNKRDSDFSGVVLYSTPKGKFVSGWFYKNGNITSALSSLYKTYTTATSKNNGPVVQSLKTNLLQAVMTCTDWYQTYTIDGVTSDPVYLDTTCVTSYIDDGGGGGLSGGSSNTGNSGGGGATSPGTTTPCTVPTTSQSASVTKGHLTVDYIQPQPVPGATNGFPPPTSDPCATTGTPISTPIFGLNNSNAIVPDGNFDNFLTYIQSIGLSMSDAINTPVVFNSIQYTGQITQIYNTEGQLVAAYFGPDISSGPFQVGFEYSIGNGEVDAGVVTGNGPSDYPEFGDPTSGFGGTISYNGPTGSVTVTSPPSVGFQPLCKSSIILTPSSSNTSQLNMSGIQFGIEDLPHFPFFKTEINVITFNLYINIPSLIVDPTDPSKNVIITTSMQQEFIYQAYHFASQQTDIAHGEDFFSIGAQPKYSKIFAANVLFYLNYIALQGIFPAYENANSGNPPKLAASTSTQLKSSPTPAVYTTAISGEGC
ncbi:MAG: hypothetical protein JWR12_508 [Mucilaginibacter sp.]|nr:hypothetical protein [Mucilaginibacter sp.]